jgi:hypothetical protein
MREVALRLSETAGAVVAGLFFLSGRATGCSESTSLDPAELCKKGQYGCFLPAGPLRQGLRRANLSVLLEARVARTPALVLTRIFLGPVLLSSHTFLGPAVAAVLLPDCHGHIDARVHLDVAMYNHLLYNRCHDNVHEGSSHLYFYTLLEVLAPSSLGLNEREDNVISSSDYKSIHSYRFLVWHYLS